MYVSGLTQHTPTPSHRPSRWGYEHMTRQGAIQGDVRPRRLRILKTTQESLGGGGASRWLVEGTRKVSWKSDRFLPLGLKSLKDFTYKQYHIFVSQGLQSICKSIHVQWNRWTYLKTERVIDLENKLRVTKGRYGTGWVVRMDINTLYKIDNEKRTYCATQGHLLNTL